MREEKSMKIDNYEDMEVYRLAIGLQQKIFVLTKSFPKEELYSLTNQIRRSSRSIGANIAEAWHKRRYAAYFISKLSDSDAEQAETQHWIRTSLLCEYIDNVTFNILMDECKHIGGMLGKMINHADTWCLPSGGKSASRTNGLTD